MLTYLYDIIIVAVLAFFAWRGAAKGLILSLCGLAAAFVAFFGAQFLSTTFCGPVSNIVRPVIVHAFQEVMPDVPDPEPVTSTPPLAGLIPEAEEEDEDPTYTMDEVLASVQEAEFFSSFSDLLSEAVANNDIPLTGHFDPLEALADYLAKAITKTVLFAITYLGIVIGWFLASHALDLAFHLPILAEINLAGGLILGLIKAVLVVIVLVWLGQMAGWVPAEPETPVLSLFTVERLSELLKDLPV